jgi:hypothetical protein
VDDDSLLSGFEDASLPDDMFHHQQHVRVAWLYVKRYGVAEAIPRFSAALKRFAAAKGAPKLYHETITWAYLLLINERMAREPVETWTAFAEAHTDLLSWKPSVLDHYYSQELLWSELARTVFVMPDRAVAAT